MPTIRQFLPCNLRKLAGNPKFDLFHSLEIAQKLGKSTNPNQNLFSSEGGQDTAACQISGHSFHAFSRKCPETPNLTSFTKSKIAPKLGKSTNLNQNLFSSGGAQDTPACQLSGYSFHAFSGKCPETPNLTSFTMSKWRQN